MSEMNMNGIDMNETLNDVKKPRVTKLQRYADIKALLLGELAQHGTTVDEAVEFIDRESELLGRKMNSPKKATETQKANMVLKEDIVSFLEMVFPEKKTCTEIQKSVESLKDFNNQKIAALVRQLLDARRVTKTMKNGKALFGFNPDSNIENG